MAIYSLYHAKAKLHLVSIVMSSMIKVFMDRYGIPVILFFASQIVSEASFFFHYPGWKIPDLKMTITTLSTIKIKEVVHLAYGDE